MEHPSSCSGGNAWTGPRPGFRTVASIGPTAIEVDALPHERAEDLLRRREVASQLLVDEAFAEAALEEELAGLGVRRQEVGLIVDELEGATVACGQSFACGVIGEAFAEIRCVTGVEVAVFGTAENVDVVHVRVSDGWQGGCQLTRGP